MKKEVFWGLMKKQIPVIIILAVINGVLGVYASYVGTKAKRLTNKIKSDNEAIARWTKELVRSCPNRIRLDELDGDDRKPVEPTKIYVYDYD